MNTQETLTSILSRLDDQEQVQLLGILRQKFPIHQLETDWNIPAEFILQAIAESQDITKRGVRSIIAELCFNTYILGPMADNYWTHIRQVGDLPYDALIEHPTIGRIKIQTKNQRLVKGVPLLANGPMVKNNPEVEGWYVCETQKTRTGKDKNQLDTRPYRFGEFDILSVCLHPSTGDWTKFIFSPAHTLIPKKGSPELIATFQPLPPTRQGNWTDSLEEAIEWHLEKRTYTPGTLI